jgi:hypothetical protein
MSGHGCPSLKLYHSRLIQSGAQEDKAVSITWLGTAGVLVSDGLTGILIDPYVSRFGFLKIAMGLPLQPDKALVKRWMARLEKVCIGIVAVSHSHFDHCLDAPYFAMEAGAFLMGSESTLNAGRGASLAEDRLKAVKPLSPWGPLLSSSLKAVMGQPLGGECHIPGRLINRSSRRGPPETINWEDLCHSDFTPRWYDPAPRQCRIYVRHV